MQNDPSTEVGELNAALAAQREKTNPEAVATITAANKQLQSSGLVTGLELGERAPHFTLPDAVGNEVALSDLLDNGPAVVNFYRGAWCPYCNITLAALQRVLDDIKGLGAQLVAISPQLPDDALSITEKHDLGFPVLSDADQHVIRAYRVQFRVPAEIEDVHLNVFKKDVTQFNGDGSWNLPVPATFVLDQQGMVRARHVDADYMQRMEPAQVLDALRRIGEA